MARETLEVIRKNKVPWKTEMLTAWKLFLHLNSSSSGGQEDAPRKLKVKWLSCYSACKIGKLKTR